MISHFRLEMALKLSLSKDLGKTDRTNVARSIPARPWVRRKNYLLETEGVLFWKPLKSEIFVLVASLLVVIGILSGIIYHGFNLSLKAPYAMIVNNVPVIVNCTFPEYPKELSVLRIVERNYTRTELSDLAEIFGITENFTVTLEHGAEVDCYYLEDAPRYLEVYTYGGICYHADDLATGPLPTESEAMKVAQELMSKILSCPLSPIHERMEVQAQGASKAGETWCFKFVTNFEGSEILNHIAVAAVGTDNEGKPLAVGLNAYWRRIQVTGTIDTTVSPREAIMRLNVLQHEPLPDKVTIEKLYLAYTAVGGIAMSQTCLPPIYIIECSVIEDGGKSRPLVDTVAATDLAMPNSS